MDGKGLALQYDRLKQDRAVHAARWEVMAPFLSPSRVGILGAVTDGQKQTTGVYDSTGMMAAEMSGQFVAGSILNPGQQWGSMSLRDPRARQDDEWQEWLEESDDRILRRFSDSMFYSESPEAMMDWVGFGTGFLLMEEQPVQPHLIQRGFRGFFCEAQKTGRFVISDGPDGLVDTAMREFRLSARVIRARWPDAALPENIKAAIDKGEGERLFTIIHAIKPRHTADQRSQSGAKGMPWASAWVEQESKTLLHESGYRRFPGGVFRYLRTPGEVYGRGRGDLAYPDIASLNRAKRMGFEDWALKIRPPILMGHDSVIGSLRLVPGGPTVVNTHGRPLRDVIGPFETGSNPQVNAIKEEELRRSIRQIFYVDQILQLMEVSKSEMTAFEFAKKMELLFTLMGPVYGRTEREFLQQVWYTAFDLLFEAGEFSPPPPWPYDSEPAYDVVFENPLARARRTSDVEAITLAVNDMAALGQLFPQMWDGFDPDKTRKHIFTVRGVPASVTRNDDEVAVFRQARAEQQQRELEMATMQQATESMKNAAPMVRALQPQGKAV